MFIKFCQKEEIRFGVGGRKMCCNKTRRLSRKRKMPQTAFLKTKKVGNPPFNKRNYKKYMDSVYSSMFFKQWKNNAAIS